MSQKRRRQEDGDASNRQPKNKRQFTDQDRQRASVYEQLADEKHGTRIQAAKKLIDEFAPSKNPDIEKLKDVFTRLIKGLCSGRKAARAGYFVAFAELLRQTSSSEELFTQATGSTQDLLRLINSLTKPDRNSPQENRDKHIGRVSAYKALLESTILSDPRFTSDENWEFFIDQTSKQARSNPWLREECGSMLCDYVTASAQLQISQDHIVKKIIEKYSGDGLLETAEGVAIWITAQKAYPDLKLPKDVWHKRDPLHSTERSRLARILCDSKGTSGPLQNQDQKKIKTSGTWKPQPNFAWRVVLQQAFVKMPSPAKLRQFCIEVIDNALFAEKASSERKFWGFSLIGWAIRSAPSDLLSALFTPNFMRSLINHRVETSRDLFIAAEGPLDAIASRGEKGVEAALTLLNTLITSDSYSHFDSVTKSSTLSRLVGNVPEEGRTDMIDAIASYLNKPPLEDPTSTTEAGKARVVYANLVIGMVARYVKHQDSVEDPWTRQVAQTLASFAYLELEDAAPAISDDSRSRFHDAVIRCVNHLLPKLANPGEWLGALVKQIQKSGGASSSRLVLKADDRILKDIATAHETLHTIRKSSQSASEDSAESLKILHLLLSLTLIEVYSGDADGVDMLSELQTCYTSLNEKETKAQAFDLLVELLLSFLSKTSSLYRQVGEFIFPILAQGMSGEGLDSLLEILSTKENAAGQGELFEAADEGEGAEEGDDDDELSMDSDVEMLSPSEDEASNDGDNSNTDDDSDDGEQDPELQQFNDLLAQTLKTGAPKANGAQEENSSEDESDMDDDQMMALDPQLTKIFQERRKAAGFGEGSSKKREKTKAKLQMTLFKSRVLDLLQIYVKKQHASEATFKVLIPLLALMRTTTSSELEKKAKTTLGTWFENCDRNKEYPTPDDADTLWAELRQVHDEVQQAGSKQHTMICGRASLFIAKMLMQQKQSNMKRLLQEYGKTQLEVIENGTSVQSSFFTEWCAWSMQWKKGSGKQDPANKTQAGIHEAPQAESAEKQGKKDNKKKKMANGVSA